MAAAKHHGGNSRGCPAAEVQMVWAHSLARRAARYIFIAAPCDPPARASGPACAAPASRAMAADARAAPAGAAVRRCRARADPARLGADGLRGRPAAAARHHPAARSARRYVFM
jgi:hypothetical protein